MKKILLRSPAGALDSLTRAIDVGADAVYMGFQSETNLRYFPGLNFSVPDAQKGIEYAHERGREIYTTINTFPQFAQLEECFRAVDQADSLGADSIIASDIAVMKYIRKNHPRMRIHLSVQAGASNYAAINFYRDHFGITCAILPRVLNLKEIDEIRKNTDVELEVFVFGSLCANYEGRCSLSSYITGRSCNSGGACSPAEFVQFDYDEDGRMKFMLNGVLLSTLEEGEVCSYPTPCKAKLKNPITGESYYVFQEPVTLSLIHRLKELAGAGVDAIKIEGRQRSGSYVEGVTRLFRMALDGEIEAAEIDLNRELAGFMEGSCFVDGLWK